MLTVNILKASTRLYELIARAVAGGPLVIAKAGKPIIQVTAIDAPVAKPKQWLGVAVIDGHMTCAPSADRLPPCFSGGGTFVTAPGADTKPLFTKFG